MKIKILSLLPVLFLIVGCVSLPDAVEFNASPLTESDKKVAVLVRELPSTYTHKVGQQGLLDMALNNATASGLTKHVRSLDLSEFEDLGDRVLTALTARGIDSFLVDSSIELPELKSISVKGKEGVYSNKDHSPLKELFAADYLLLINPSAVGTIRSYYGFIPTSAPAGYYNGVGDLIDLATNEILWLRRATVQKPVEDWNEKDIDYPELTNAIYQAIEEAHSKYLQDFELRRVQPAMGE